MQDQPDIFETDLDVLGLPTRWDLRRRRGVCLALGCGNSAQGLVPSSGGPWAHDCPCCLEHCTYSEMADEVARQRARHETGEHEPPEPDLT